MPRSRGCRPRTACTTSFRYPGFYATLQNMAPGLETKRRGDLQRHLHHLHQGSRMQPYTHPLVRGRAGAQAAPSKAHRATAKCSRQR